MHALQKVAVVEIRVRGSTLSKKVKKYENIVRKIKAKIQGTKQEMRIEKESKYKLKNFINIVCLNFDDVKMSQEIPLEDKVLRLGKTAVDLTRKVR